MKILALNAILLLNFLLSAKSLPLETKEDDLVYVRRTEFEALKNLVDEVVGKLDETKSNKVLNTDFDKVSVSANPKALGATSCLDLWKANQTTPGFYLVRSSDAKKMSAVYCDVSTFTENVIGYLDVKTAPVYFAGLRPGEFKNNNVAITITYPTSIVNHESFSGISGRFTAPVSGIYKFDYYSYAFSHRDAGDSTSNGARVVLLINGAPTEGFNYAASDKPAELPISFTYVVRLARNDFVETRFQYGNLRDCHFSGILLEADLA